MRTVLAFLALAALAAPALAQPPSQWEQRIVGGQPTLVQIAGPKAPPAEPKVAAPEVKPEPKVEAPPAVGAAHLPTGVRFDKLSPIEKCSYGGTEVDPRSCYALLGGNSLADDSAKRSVSISDPDPKRRDELFADIKAAVGDRAKVWEGPPDDWSWRPGFRPAKDRPTIVCQAADGEVLHRQEGLEGGKEALIEAVRKAVPDYDPGRDPDLRRASPFTIDPRYLTANNLAGVILLLGGAVFLFFALRK